MRLLLSMRQLALALLLTGVTLPAFAAKQVTVAELEKLLTTEKGKPDEKLAKQLSSLELTERASSPRLVRWEASLPGDRSRQALVGLADASAFLRIPAADIPTTPMPDHAAQMTMLLMTREYLRNIIPTLPNFFATRDTLHFAEKPIFRSLYDTSVPSPVDPASQSIPEIHQPLESIKTDSDTVYFRQGKEDVAAQTSAGPKLPRDKESFVVQGVFGQVNELILGDVFPGPLIWDHWEASAEASLAVFHYAVPRERSHFQVQEQDVIDLQVLKGVLLRPVGYHGEIAVEPATGIVRRFTQVAELKATNLLPKAEEMAEFDPVEIGGKNYYCLVKGIYISVLQKILNPLPQEPFPFVRLQRLMNDVQYKQYHRFRPEMRILPGVSEVPAAKPSAP